jgi:hypothetical protein
MIKFVKMKKKIIFAVATVFNMNMAKSCFVGDVSLQSIAVMAQAQSEIPNGTNCGTSYQGPYCGFVELNGTRFQTFWP